MYWRWIYKWPLALIRYHHEQYRYQFVVAILFITFFLIESVGNSAFVKMSGMMMMMILGMICGEGETVTRQLKDGKIAQPSIIT